MNNETVKIPIYCRVGNYGPDGLAMEAQIIHAKNRANEMGLDGDFVIFTEIGSAIIPMEQRKGLMDCLNFVEQNRPTYLFVTRRDRLARNAYEYIDITRRIKACNTKIVFCAQGEPQIEEGVYNMLLNSLVDSLAEFEKQQYRQRSLDSHKFQVENGNAVISTPPYGYSYHSGTKSYKVNKAQAAVISEIFSLFLKGTTSSQIAEYLNDKGIKTKLGNLWTRKSILNIIQNPFYCGYQRLSYAEYQDNKEVRIKIIQKCDKIFALISEEEYQSAQAILKNSPKPSAS